VSTAAYIGSSIHIKGEVTAQEPLTIAGQVDGTIDVGGHALTVTEGARINATVVAHTIVVAGAVNGRLTASGRIVVEKTAVVEGDVAAPTAIVHDGATVHGQLAVEGRRESLALAS